MIVKGATRSGPTQLANYLLRVYAPDPTEHVAVLDLDYATGNLLEAFRDWHTVGEATRGEKTLYHAQINPAPGYAMTPQQWQRAADILAEELGLQDHPRAIVLHDDGERPHIHVVWQRTNIDTMTLWDDGQNYAKHEKASQRMELEFGHDFVPGKHAKRDRDQQPEFPRSQTTHAEQQQAERTRLDPQAFKETITQIYHQCDSGQALKTALEENGFILATGDKRAFVIVDQEGQVYSLSRQLLDVKAKELKELLKDIGQLPNVEEAKALQREPIQQAPEPPKITQDEWAKRDDELKEHQRQEAQTLKDKQLVELDKLFRKAEEHSDEWVRKFDALLKHRWNPAAAEQQRLENRQLIEATLDRQRIEREIMIEMQRLQRTNQFIDHHIKPHQPQPEPAKQQPAKIQIIQLPKELAELYDIPTPPQPHTPTKLEPVKNDDLIKIEIALKERHGKEIQKLKAVQDAERNQTTEALNRDFEEKLQDFDAIQEAACVLYDREHKAPQGIPADFAALLNRQKSIREAVERDRHHTEFLNEQRKERNDRIEYWNSVKAHGLENMTERHYQQQRELSGKYQGDLARYTGEYQDSQKLLAEMEEQSRQQEHDRKPDEPEPPRRSL